MARLGLLFLLTLSAGPLSAAERAVAPVEIRVPLTAPAVNAPALPGAGGWLGIPGLESPATLAAQLLLPPSVIVNFGPAQGRPDAAVFTPNQAQSAPQTGPTAPAQAAPATAGPQAAANPLTPGAESGVVPIEFMGEGSHPAMAQRSQDRLAATDGSLRAPLGELRDAPADGGESLHSVASRVWDMVAGRRTGRFVAGPMAGHSAFAPAGSGGAAHALAVPDSAADAPLAGSAGGAAVAVEAGRFEPSSIALVLMNVFGQRLNLTSSPIPRLEPGAGVGVRGVRADAVDGSPAKQPALPASSVVGDVPAPFVAHEAAAAAASQADLPSSTWRAEAEWVSFGESGQGASGTAEAAEKSQASSSVAKPEAARIEPGTWLRDSSAARRRRAVEVPLPVSRAMAASLSLSAFVALAGLALLAWPESR
jgi:hypothetical protein